MGRDPAPNAKVAFVRAGAVYLLASVYAKFIRSYTILPLLG